MKQVTEPEWKLLKNYWFCHWTQVSNETFPFNIFEKIFYVDVHINTGKLWQIGPLYYDSLTFKLPFYFCHLDLNKIHRSLAYMSEHDY